MTKASVDLKIVYRDPKELVPYVTNARTHSDEQVRQIAASIKEFGFNDPVELDGDKGIISGHGRVQAALLLGLDRIPTVDLYGLTEPQKKAYIIAANKIGLNSGWDEEKLRLEIEDLKLTDTDLTLTGFNEAELAELESTGAEGAEAGDLDFVDQFNQGYNITIFCENLEEAKKLDKLLGLDLDLTRQVLKRDFKDIRCK